MQFCQDEKRIEIDILDIFACKFILGVHIGHLDQKDRRQPNSLPFPSIFSQSYRTPLLEQIHESQQRIFRPVIFIGNIIFQHINVYIYIYILDNVAAGGW